jgi:hypothetical protein
MHGHGHVVSEVHGQDSIPSSLSFNYLSMKRVKRERESL